MGHLVQLLPEVFEQVVVKSSVAAALAERLTYVGREAVLATIVPNVGTLHDIHGGVWDGVQLHSKNSHMSFGLCKFTKVSLTPVDGATVKITKDEQVSTHTVFVD